MNYTVRFSDAAEDDVIELLTYLLPRAGERVARLYVDQIVDHCHSFERFPERGSRLESKLGVRLVGYRRKATIASRPSPVFMFASTNGRPLRILIESILITSSEAPT